MQEVERGKPTPGHVYPERYKPGSGDLTMDEIWECLDHITPGVIPLDVREFIAGYWRGHVEKVLRRSLSGAGNVVAR